MYTINNNNFKVIVNKLKRKFYQLQRISKNQVITIYANEKDLQNKIALLSQSMTNIKKVYGGI